MAFANTKDPWIDYLIISKLEGCYATLIIQFSRRKTQNQDWSLLVFIKCNKNIKDSTSAQNIYTIVAFTREYSRVSLFIFSTGKQRVKTKININHVSTNLINQVD
jgi:hypothetical protein